MTLKHHIQSPEKIGLYYVLSIHDTTRLHKKQQQRERGYWLLGEGLSPAPRRIKAKKQRGKPDPTPHPARTDYDTVAFHWSPTPKQNKTKLTSYIYDCRLCICTVFLGKQNDISSSFLPSLSPNAPSTCVRAP